MEICRCAVNLKRDNPLRHTRIYVLVWPYLCRLRQTQQCNEKTRLSFFCLSLVNLAISSLLLQDFRQVFALDRSKPKTAEPFTKAVFYIAALASARCVPFAGLFCLLLWCGVLCLACVQVCAHLSIVVGSPHLFIDNN